MALAAAPDNEASAAWKRDLVAGVLAIVAVGAIVTNAAFLQKGRHPAPMFAPRPAAAAEPAPKSARLAGQESTGSAAVKSDALAVEPQKIETPRIEPVALPRPRPAQLAAAPRHDPIADLITTSSKSRVLAVQKVLTDYGFGQFRPTGTMGPDTKQAIEQFERSRKLPVTGQISPRLIRELSALTGRPIE